MLPMVARSDVSVKTARPADQVHDAGDCRPEKDSADWLADHPTRVSSSWAPQRGFKIANRPSRAVAISTTSAKRTAGIIRQVQKQNNPQSLTRATARMAGWLGSSQRRASSAAVGARKGA